MGSREAAPVRDSQAEAGAQHGIVLKHTCPLGQRIAEPTLQGGNNGGRVDSVVQVLAVQQIADGLDFRPHLAPRALELGHGAPIATPSEHHQARAHDAHRPPHHEQRPVEAQPAVAEQQPIEHEESDRKSTRLNSSHSQISYAVFCLKKKITYETYNPHATV